MMNSKLKQSVFFLVSVVLSGSLFASATVQDDRLLRVQHAQILQLIFNPDLMANSLSGAGTSSSGYASQMKLGGGAARVSRQPGSVPSLRNRNPATIQKLEQGMLMAEEGIDGLKKATGRNAATLREQKRNRARLGLEQVALSYLTARSEAKVPVMGDYSKDPFLSQLANIRNQLDKKEISTATAAKMLNQLAGVKADLQKMPGVQQ